MDRHDLVRRLGALDTCAVSDALDALGLSGAIGGIVPLWPGGRVAGPVRTVALRPVGPDEEPAEGPHLGAKVIDSAGPGDVIVVANGGRVDSAAWGGLLSSAARRNGVAGVVIDGACRDVDEALELGFPVFAWAATPVSARGRAVEAAIDVPVEVAGLSVSPGDLLLADRSGIVVVPSRAAEEVVKSAERIAVAERAMADELSAGATVQTVLDHRYETMLRRIGDDRATEQVGGGSHAVD